MPTTTNYDLFILASSAEIASAVAQYQIDFKCVFGSNTHKTSQMLLPLPFLPDTKQVALKSMNN